MSKTAVRSSSPVLRPRLWCPACRLLTILCAALWFSPRAEAAIFRVGPSSDPACSATTMATALASAASSAGEDEIRVSRAYDHDGSTIAISNQSVRIVGGFANCSGTPSPTNAVLDGTGAASGPTLRVSCSTGPCSVRFEDLSIEGGEDSNLEISGEATVFLTDTLVGFSATANDGGAVRIDATDGAHLVVLGISLIGNATAGGNGGGVYCRGTLSTRQAMRRMQMPDGVIIEVEREIEFVDGVLVNGRATNGGGVYLTQGCRMRYTATGGFSGLLGNIATQRGGGIALVDGASLEFRGNRLAPAVLSNNEARDGGGLYVAFGIAELYNAHVLDNNASDRGAGIMVENEGTVLMASVPPLCGYPHCSSLSSNGDSSGLLYGGGAFLWGRVNFSLFGTHVLGNAAHNASAFFVGTAERGSGAAVPDVIVGSSIFANNSGASRVIEGIAASIEIDGSTFSNNRHGVAGQTLSAVLYTAYNRLPDTPASGITVTRSVFDNPEGVFGEREPAPFLGSLLGLCIVANAVGATVPLLPGSVLESGVLVAPAAGDWRPRSDSAAIDLCDGLNSGPYSIDIFQNPRGVDDPGVVNLGGTFDAGAIERGNPPLFASGFENP